MTPLISIIIPYYNATKYIKETIESIIAQTYEEWELIIIDDCSTDPETVNILQIIKNLDSRIRILHTEKNGGAGYARNIGIREALGRYIAFCDSDDWWYPNKLEKQLLFMQNNGYEFTFTDYEDCDENLNVLHTFKQRPILTLEEAQKGCSVGTPGAMYDTSRIGKLYMPNIRRSEDWGLWLKILQRTKNAYAYPEALWKYRHLPGSVSSFKFAAFLCVVQMYQEVLGFSKCKSYLYFFFIFMPTYVLKRIKNRY